MAAMVVACSPASPPTPHSGALLQVTERDFKISASPVVPSGDVILRVSNDGPDHHELILVRSDTATLPLRPDGVTVDEDHLESETVATMEAAPAGSVRRLSLRLTRGSYVLFCNMAGHYLGGMHAEFRAT
jgi:uncharacterized cupredoxin-like copper-binding protein